MFIKLTLAGEDAGSNALHVRATMIVAMNRRTWPGGANTILVAEGAQWNVVETPDEIVNLMRYADIER